MSDFILYIYTYYIGILIYNNDVFLSSCWLLIIIN